MNPTQRLRDAGQSIWLDNIRKELISEGILAGYIRDLGVTGLTSNPTILERAIADGDSYGGAIRGLTASGITDPEAMAFALALQDLGAAADLLRPIFDESGGIDGYVSIEVPPELIDDPDGTVAAGERLWSQAGRPNVMIKVPGTTAGLRAVETLVARGIPVNVTLLFSSGQYEDAADAYLPGLERRQAEALPLGIGSVASVFVSRWDAAADPRIPTEHRPRIPGSRPSTGASRIREKAVGRSRPRSAKASQSTCCQRPCSIASSRVMRRISPTVCFQRCGHSSAVTPGRFEGRTRGEDLGVAGMACARRAPAGT